MMYYQVCWLLPLVISAAVRVNCELEDIPLIQWEADCDSYELTTGVKPLVPEIHFQRFTTLDQCRSLCTARRDCGGFDWYAVSDWCRLYNINDQIIEQYLPHDWYESELLWTTWYSKTSCGYFIVDDIPLIQWDADCDSYKVTTGVRPVVDEIHHRLSTPLDQCRSVCTARRDCGGFDWHTNNNCYIYNINDQIIDQYFSQNWYRSNSSYTWYSKTCDYDVGATDLSCDIYTETQYHNQYPNTYKWKITGTNWIPDGNATECQVLCGLYTGCRSVTWYQSHLYDVGGSCYLFETTVQDLLDTGLGADVTHITLWHRHYDDGSRWRDNSNSTTYDRYCAGGAPYIPDLK